MYSQFHHLVDLLRRFPVVAGHAICVHAVLIRFHLEISFRQERQVNLQIACRPIRHRTHVPVSAVSSRHCHILANSPFHSSCLVPRGRPRPSQLPPSLL